MCGIAGAVALHPAASPQDEIVREMSRCVAHRGPDGAGLWTSPSRRAVLAHRRLAIIDLMTGAQPQVSPDGQIALVFNGEIYNYKELRVELEQDGCVFRTNPTPKFSCNSSLAKATPVFPACVGCLPSQLGMSRGSSSCSAPRSSWKKAPVLGNEGRRLLFRVVARSGTYSTAWLVHTRPGGARRLLDSRLDPCAANHF